jgi:hypothetical protein
MSKLISTWGDGLYWDVAQLPGSDRHVIMRHDETSLCGRLARALDKPAYVGSHDGGQLPNCPICRHELAVRRDRRAREMGVTE